MTMHFDISELIGKIYILINNDIIVDVADTFIELTEYKKEEIIDKPVYEVFTTMLRANVDINCISSQSEIECFIFTKYMDARNVEISVMKNEYTAEKIYVLAEKYNSRLDMKFPIICRLLENDYPGTYNGIAIFSAPDLTLLKADKIYLNFLAEPYNKPQNVIGRIISNYIPNFAGSMSEQIFSKIITSKEIISIREAKGFFSGIDDRYWDSTLVPMMEEGKVKYIVSFLSDVTEKVLNRIQIEEQNKIILQHKDQLNAVIQNMTDGVFLLDKDDNLTLLNQSSKDYFYQPEIIQKKGDSFRNTRYFDMQGKELFIEDLVGTRVFRGEYVKNSRVIVDRPDKTLYYSLSGSPIYNDEGFIESAIICCRDITVQVEKEQMEFHKKEQFNAIIENMSDGLFLIDKTGHYILLNQAAKSIVYQPETFLQIGDSQKTMKYFDFNGTEFSIKDVLLRILKGEKIKISWIKVERPDISLYLSMNANPIYNNDGEVISAVICCHDITDQVVSEQLIYQTERKEKEILKKEIEMKNQFLSLITHEFKTPLTVINLAVQTMEMTCKETLTPKAKGLLNNIRQNVFRQMRLVSNLLDITRINAGHVKIDKKNLDIVSLTKSIIESVLLYSEQKEIELTFTTTLDQMVIGIDDEKYERILLNLLSNAIKFTPKGKWIAVKVSTFKSKVRIEIKDKGIGIPEDKLDLIFERFGQVDSSLSRQAEGTGIGLTLVQLFVEALNGSITVKSKPGLGSTFTILLPAEKVSNEQEERSFQELNLFDNRHMQAVSIEFSDIYH